MILSINPWYYCNFRCSFCYLTTSQLSDKKLLDINRLSEMLAEVTSRCEVTKVDLYGGELGLLPKDYWEDLIAVLLVYGIEDINLITNLSMVNDITIDPRVYTSVSFDFSAREDWNRVWRNMALLPKKFSILMLAGPDLLPKSVDEIVLYFNTLSNLESVEVKPYSSNQANAYTIPYTEYENFVKKIMIHPKRKFELVNEQLIETVLDKSRNSFSDDHVYITPNGKYGVLEFDLNDNEFFEEYESLDEYFEWCEKEKARVNKNKFCSECEHFGHCLSEHLREVKSIENSCNGFVKLIDWYKNERLENKTRTISQVE